MLQKKKQRSSVPRATQKPKSKRLPVKASPLVAANWDKRLTLSQNYRHLGLTSRLNARSGGTEVKAADTERRREEKRSEQDPLAVAATRPATATGLKTAKVVRGEDGRILRVIHDEKGRKNPLNDPLAALDEDRDAESASDGSLRTDHDTMKPTGVVPQLEAAAQIERTNILEKKKPRKQSQREQEWIERLIAKYGQDIRSMSRDRKLNLNQQTEADIRRRLEIWHKSRQRSI